MVTWTAARQPNKLGHVRSARAPSLQKLLSCQHKARAFDFAEGLRTVISLENFVLRSGALHGAVNRAERRDRDVEKETK